MDSITSPEQLNDYMRVTNPAVWVVLAAVILLLAGMLLWGSIASIDSFASGTAQVRDGVMSVTFDDPQIASSVQAGMTITVGETSSEITSVGVAEDGSRFALANTSLTDGLYTAQVVYRTTQIFSLLFN